MKIGSRLLVAFLILFSGVALSPILAAKSANSFRWQLFAGAYGNASLAINYASGAPGSYFSVSATGFPPNTSLQVTVNHQTLASLTTDAFGNLDFILSTADADPGQYIVTILGGPSVEPVSFSVKVGDEIRQRGSFKDEIIIPSGIALKSLYLPMIHS